MGVERYALVESVSDEQILSIIRSTFGRKARMEHCARIITNFNTAYHVKIANPGVEAILRIAPHPSKPLLDYERNMMAAEPLVCGMMHNAGVPVPNILAFDNSKTVIDRDFIFVEYVDAVTMDDKSVPMESKPALMRELGAYVARVHSIKGSQFGWPTGEGSIRGYAKWSKVFYGYFDELCTRLVDADVIRREDASTLMGRLKDDLHIFDECTEPVLIHGDLWEPNVLVSSKEGGYHIKALVDIERAMFADREFEFVLWQNDPAFMEGYGTPLDMSPNAVLRRKYYFLSLNMWDTWAFRVQIWDPDAYQVWYNGLIKLLAEMIQPAEEVCMGDKR